MQRVFGIRETTLRLWLTRVGQHTPHLYEHVRQSLVLTHVPLDELYTTARQREHDLWLWVVLDALTQFIPACVVGPRTQDLAHQLIHQMRETRDRSHLPVFSSDGLKLYFMRSRPTSINGFPLPQ